MPSAELEFEVENRRRFHTKQKRDFSGGRIHGESSSVTSLDLMLCTVVEGTKYSRQDLNPSYTAICSANSAYHINHEICSTNHDSQRRVSYPVPE